MTATTLQAITDDARASALAALQPKEIHGTVDSLTPEKLLQLVDATAARAWTARQDQIHILEQTLDARKASIASLNASLAARIQERDQARARATEAETEKSLCQIELDRVQVILNEVTNASNAIIAQRNEAQAERDLANSTLEQARAKIDELAVTLRVMQAENSADKRSLSDAMATAQRWADEVSEKEKEVQRVTGIARRLQAQLNAHS